MRWISGIITLVLVITLIGCSRGNPGGPGAVKDKATDKVTTTDKVTSTDKTTTTDKASTDKTSTVDSSKTFTLDPPNLSTNIKQGEEIQLSIGINRGKNFDQDVSLKFEGVPKGIEITEGAKTFKKTEDKAKVSLKAAKDAELGDFTIKVVGQPATGPDASNTFKITVKKSE
jgi:hypothetical protein